MGSLVVVVVLFTCIVRVQKEEGVGVTDLLYLSSTPFDSLSGVFMIAGLRTLDTDDGVYLFLRNVYTSSTPRTLPVY